MTYHSTIAEYRDEMHHDLELAYRRFALDGALAWLGSAPRYSNGAFPTSPEVRGATEDVDLAAFWRRSQAPDGAAGLNAALNKFFDLLSPTLIEELGKGVDAPDQPNRADKDSHFLSQLYHLFYSEAFRSWADGTTIFAGNYNTGGVGPAWDAVLAALKGPRPINVTSALRAHVQTLCQKLKAEFTKDIWMAAW